MNDEKNPKEVEDDGPIRGAVSEGEFRATPPAQPDSHKWLRVGNKLICQTPGHEHVSFAKEK